MPSHARTHQLQRSLLYHIYSRSSNRQQIFKEPTDFTRFEQLLRDYRERFQATIYHWVIMPTHYHIVAELLRPEIVSTLLAGLHRAYSHYYHRVNATVGYLWQGRFKMQPIQRELYLKACGRYVERNPVRADIVDEPWKYPHSSAKFYCLGAFDGITSTDPYFMELGADEQTRRLRYRDFLADFDRVEEQFFMQLEKPCGTKDFVDRLLRKDGHLFPRHRGRP